MNIFTVWIKRKSQPFCLFGAMDDCVPLKGQVRGAASACHCQNQGTHHAKQREVHIQPRMRGRNTHKTTNTSNMNNPVGEVLASTRCFSKVYLRTSAIFARSKISSSSESPAAVELLRSAGRATNKLSLCRAVGSPDRDTGPGASHSLLNAPPAPHGRQRGGLQWAVPSAAETPPSGRPRLHLKIGTMFPFPGTGG